MTARIFGVWVGMVTRRASVAALCLLLGASAWAGQTEPAAPLTAAQLSAHIGSEADTQAALSLVLTRALRNNPRPGTAFVLANQIRGEWLPVIAGVQIVRLADTEVPKHLAGCGIYWFIANAQREANVVAIELRQRCGGTTLKYVAGFDGREWQSPPSGIQSGFLEGIGSGFVGRPPGCPCVGR